MSKDIEQYADEKAIRTAINIAKEAKWPEERIREYIKENFNLEDKEIDKYFEPVMA